MWVRAVEQYAKIYRVVEPKRHRLRVAETQLKEKMTLLQEAKNKLAEVCGLGINMCTFLYLHRNSFHAGGSKNGRAESNL